MATTKAVFPLLFSLFVFFLLLLPHACIDAQSLKVCKFDGIYQLGDSVSDTGNLIREKPALPFARLPYGQTFFKKPTGRCSNGLLIIDYIGKNLTSSCFCFLFFFVFNFLLVSKKNNQNTLLVIHI